MALDVKEANVVATWWWDTVGAEREQDGVIFQGRLILMLEREQYEKQARWVSWLRRLRATVEGYL